MPLDVLPGPSTGPWPANGVPFLGRAVPLGPDDIEAAAKDLGCDTAKVKAVITVESGGASGFLADKRPRILFEAAVFGRLTRQRFTASHPNISAPAWDRSLYKGGAREYDRLAEAYALDAEAALQSASWGLTQVMGSNYRIAGWADVDSFVDAMCDDEAWHLHAFLNFCRATGCADELVAGDWAGFARIYNGPGYAQNRYDTKLATAYQQALAAGGSYQPAGSVARGRVLRIGMRGPDCLALQQALVRVGYDLVPDGVFGRVTEIMVERFQEAACLPADGVVGPQTQAALDAAQARPVATPAT